MTINPFERRTGIKPFDASPACWGWEPPTDADRERVREEFASVAKSMGEQLFEELLPGFLMIDWQQNRCAICGRDRGLNGNFVEDHDHETGLVRGYLCGSCNTMEGLHPEPEARIFREYRERNPASICGVVERYYNPYTREFAEPVPPRGDPWEDNPLRGVGILRAHWIRERQRVARCGARADRGGVRPRSDGVG